MKTLLFSYKFLFMTLMALPLSLCSKDNDDPQQDFEPVTISLENVNIGKTDTSFSVDGFNFKSDSAESSPENLIQGIGIWPGTIELDLNNITGISKITVYMHNNGAGSTLVSVLNGSNVLKEITDVDIPAGYTNVEIDVSNLSVDALRIFSGEAIIISIKLE